MKALIAPRSLDRLRTVVLEHPRTGEKCTFLLGRDDVLELIRVDADGAILAGEGVLPRPSFYIATHVDPLFLLLPTLKRRERVYMSAEDLFELEGDWRYVVERRGDTLDRVCDTLEQPGVGRLWRLNMGKLGQALDAKAARLEEQLPPSVVQVAVTNALAPVNANDPPVPPGIIQLARREAAWGMVGSYLPSSVASELRARTSLHPLVEYKARLRAARQEAVQQRMELANEFARKREAAEDRALAASTAGGTKKRTERQPSLAVKKLSKVNTSGMNKMNAFFKKVESQ